MRIIALLGLIAGIFLASFVAQSILNAVGVPLDLMAASGAGQIVNYAIVLICAYLFVTRVWRQSVTGYFQLYWQNGRKALDGFLAGAGLALAVGLLWYLFVFAAGGAHWSSAAWAQTDARALLKLLLPDLIAIVLATTEEILFRSLAFRYLLTSNTRWAVLRAILVSAFIFALAHRFDDPRSWFELRFLGLLIGLTLLGCLLALVYYLTNSLACSIGAHTGLIWIAIAKKTQVIQVASSGWEMSNSFDPRTGPAAWLLFVLLAVLFWSLRRWLRASYAIENFDDGTRRDAEPRVTGRDWQVAILGTLACIAGFIAMQNMIERKLAHDAATFPATVNEFKLALSRGASLDAAARAARLQPADYLRYGLDKLTRQANGQVEIAGLAADMPGDGHPLTILVLAGNKTVFQGETAGARVDFARGFMLTDAAARHVMFGGPLSCAAGEALLGVVLSPTMTYVSFPFRCP
ncbi:MAG: CPBP family intramembrane metalloprotease [Rhizobiales bacterium]|nr:CPBP family intramembrane metalloprotease [Hyphomicrobiales bacterium]